MNPTRTESNQRTPGRPRSPDEDRHERSVTRVEARAPIARSDVGGEDATGFAIGCLSGAVRKGSWEPPAKLYAIAIMGGVQLDFCEADLLEGVTEIVAVGVMGGIKIAVPPDVHVETTGFGLMGGFSHFSQRAAEDDAPTLRIAGLACMGGVEIKRKKSTWTEKARRLLEP